MGVALRLGVFLAASMALVAALIGRLRFDKKYEEKLTDEEKLLARENARRREKERQEKIEKERIAKIIERERMRTEKEKWQTKEIRAGWQAVSSLLLIIFLILLAIYGYVHDAFNWGYGIPIFLLLILMVNAYDIEKRWKEKLFRFKGMIYKENKNYKLFDYKYDYIYTDSDWEYLIYLFAKIVAYLIPVIVAMGVGTLIFSWLATITASTIIIILLIILIIIALDILKKIKNRGD